MYAFGGKKKAKLVWSCVIPLFVGGVNGIKQEDYEIVWGSEGSVFFLVWGIQIFLASLWALFHLYLGCAIVHPLKLFLCLVLIFCNSKEQLVHYVFIFL